MTASRSEREEARFDARLATFTRYAAVVSEQFSAALRGDAALAGALAEERAQLGEHFAELRAAAPAGGEAGAPSFDAMLAGAIEELDHQMGVEMALRQRLATLRDEALRVLHEPASADAAGQGRTARAAAALAALDPAAVSGGALAPLVAPPVAPPPAPPAPDAYRAAAGARRLDVRF